MAYAHSSSMAVLFTIKYAVFHASASCEAIAPLSVHSEMTGCKDRSALHFEHSLEHELQRLENGLFAVV